MRVTTRLDGLDNRLSPSAAHEAAIYHTNWKAAQLNRDCICHPHTAEDELRPPFPGATATRISMMSSWNMEAGGCLAFLKT
jgi:hypothetical protein